MSFFAGRDRQRQHHDTLIQQIVRFPQRGHATDTPCWRFVIVDLARLFGKALADVFAVAHIGLEGILQLFLDCGKAFAVTDFPGIFPVR